MGGGLEPPYAVLETAALPAELYPYMGAADLANRPKTDAAIRRLWSRCATWHRGYFFGSEPLGRARFFSRAYLLAAPTALLDWPLTGRLAEHTESRHQGSL